MVTNAEMFHWTNNEFQNVEGEVLKKKPVVMQAKLPSKIKEERHGVHCNK